MTKTMKEEVQSEQSRHNIRERVVVATAEEVHHSSRSNQTNPVTKQSTKALVSTILRIYSRLSWSNNSMIHDQETIYHSTNLET
jgi:hypothetical protein